MTREEILEAAAQIFCEKGFHAASMQDIAQAVNLQKASLYHHISSKQEILVDLLDQALDLLIKRMEEVTARPLPADEKLRLAMRTYLETLIEHNDRATVLLFEHRSLEPKLKRRHVPRRDRFESLWREIVEEGIGEGLFNGTDPGLVAKELLGVMNWTIMWYRGDGKLSITEIADHGADLFLNGLLYRKK